MYNNNGGSPNKYDCQFLKCIFMNMNEILQNEFLLYR